MPVDKFQFLGPKIIWGLWKITEPLEVLSAHADQIAGMEREPIKHPERLREWLASRLLTKFLLDKLDIEWKGISKDTNKAPSFYNSTLHLSISHSHGYAGAIISDIPYPGIDLQTVSDKIHRISNRFLSPEELSIPNLETEHLTLFWTAKETLFKVYRAGNLDFRKHILLDPQINEHDGIMKGTINTENFIQNYTLYYYRFENCIITLKP